MNIFFKGRDKLCREKFLCNKKAKIYHINKKCNFTSITNNKIHHKYTVEIKLQNMDLLNANMSLVNCYFTCYS